MILQIKKQVYKKIHSKINNMVYLIIGGTYV